MQIQFKMKMQILPKIPRFHEVDENDGKVPKSQEKAFIAQWGSSKAKLANNKKETMTRIVIVLALQ